MAEQNKAPDINVADQVMDRIKAEKITMRPHWQFVAEKLGLESVALLALLIAVLAFSLIMDFWQTNEVARLARLGVPGFRAIVLNFPYELTILILVAVVGVNYILKRLDWGYKRSWLVWLALFITVAVLLAVGSLTIGLQRRLLLAGRMPAAAVMRSFYGHRIRPIANEAIVGTVNEKLGDRIELVQDGIALPTASMFLKCVQMHRGCTDLHRGDRIKVFRQRINNESMPWGYDFE